MKVKERLEALRSEMKAAGLAAYYVPSTDPHNSEYVAHTWRRRAFISGFDGSAGTVVVTLDRAGLWTDSRYFLQAATQLEGSGIELFKMGEPGVPEIEEWLPSVLEAGDRVGVDPLVVPVSVFRKLSNALSARGIVLEAVEADLVERVWSNLRPPMPTGLLSVHPVERAGVSVKDKLARLVAELEREGADAHVIAALDENAWLFNLRGSDVDYNPVFISYSVVMRDKTLLLVDPGKVTREVREALPPEVEIRPYEELDLVLAMLGERKAVVWLDPDSVNHHVATTLEKAGARVKYQVSPVPRWKAVKNEVEIAGMKGCHKRDGAAMVRFLRWLEETVPALTETELSIAAKAQEVRRSDPMFVGMSFSTIVGYGPNGAIVHYSPCEESNAKVLPEGLLLVDSGAQYLDGTTDITRTVALGTPTPEQRRAYTAVLKGHLQFARTIFPVGTNGYQLDVLARAALWRYGLNYGHGTGHGVGAYLCVHEGPFSVSLRKNMTPLEPGNILSNEPGFYVPGGYGIRIENLMLVVDKMETESGRFLGFENLTLCPYDRNLIDPGMLDEAELRQVNEYHALVNRILSPLLDSQDRHWLERATQPL